MSNVGYNEIKCDGWICPVTNEMMAEFELTDGQSVTKDVMNKVNARKFEEAAKREGKAANFDIKDVERQLDAIMTTDEGQVNE